ncbi:hypothetical protein BDB00DRAFT_850477 [Zychaea mexicana]|uniref:uncharacterized protein n=1 Tax=Zychaea mexicana TaxID=64656 RepID=UPI0022FDBB1F|nr:uncharacterized protein BDB00DRAFT_850477 [Zychaea mexicana]KAI9487979.1 hypothetical protein BDB00DRAFT_850477 [Zychaea mexicana]
MSTRIQRQTEDNEETGLAKLVDKTFDTYQATLFHAFQTERRARKKSEDSLKVALCSNLQLRLPKERETTQSSTSKYQQPTRSKGQILSVQFNTCPIEQWDSPFTPIEIVVRIKMDRLQKEIGGSVIMLPNKEQPENSDLFCSYPLLLVRATRIVWLEIQTWLERSLDCHVRLLNLTPNILSNITEWWAGQLFDLPPSENERIIVANKNIAARNSKLELELTVSGTRDLSTINIAMSVPDIMNIFAVIRASNISLLDAIQTQVHNSMRLQLGALRLTRIGTPIAYIDISQNKLKLMSNISKAQVIRLLEDFCEIGSTEH